MAVQRRRARDVLAVLALRVLWRSEVSEWVQKLRDNTQAFSWHDRQEVAFELDLIASQLREAREQLDEANAKLAALNLCDPHFLDRVIRERDAAREQLVNAMAALKATRDDLDMYGLDDFEDTTAEAIARIDAVLIDDQRKSDRNHPDDCPHSMNCEWYGVPLSDGSTMYLCKAFDCRHTPHAQTSAQRGDK